MKTIHILAIAIVILITSAIIVQGTLNVDAHMGPPTKIIGSDNKGTVTKITYSNSSNSTKKIAVVTGMHPRETSAKNIVPQVVKSYTKNHNVEIVNYKINVTAYPENFYTGRNNGEYLVSKYVVPDIKKSKYGLVIICHDHEEGYGEGYYFATPSMDTKSMEIAQSMRYILTDFNFCTRDLSKKADSTSIEMVDDPIVATGNPVIVYEIPEWLGKADVVHNTTRLLDSVFKSI
ncbi:MAG: hypothetical protein CVV28_09775 [Methanobacteriales archaeon HGW-Methanobacteriales-1]|jgi:hypothetical protein|nr:MAG: hypothetical protein CVV28_09775 [Methanobacteriales archaeon HGW-Methanobacteriales-1]